MALWRIWAHGEERLARGGPAEGPKELLPRAHRIDTILATDGPTLEEVLASPHTEPLDGEAQVLAPIGSQEVWAAGVTYRRSRDARMEESTEADHYDRVYDADRPEIFFKATAPRVRGPGEPIGIRADSTWDVPEPELGLVLDADGELAGYVIGDDVSSRSIEGDNPLYLPQAKSYTGSCAIGPCIVAVGEAPALGDMVIELIISRDGAELYTDTVAVTQMKRRPQELATWLCAALTFPHGVFLLTGTAIVPPAEFTLAPDDDVSIRITDLGLLRNRVERVGAVIGAVSTSF